ncbi:hypothetical protein [Streptomyces sp. AK02-01A]|uniref:hypothetical protein n=1 Tax=Streptomyces sp. AK02-01A TaxID=3028648 RepID=UPI0029BCA996|nr:hypothetical protein [Streptomyces sp. AK02-01A]MDX3849475.1 hypothetical protein [Streptomyces sp. AK02-01A]
MVPVAYTTQNIEITAENLQAQLHRLEEQRQALERELAAVVAHLGSVQKALGVLQDLMRVAPAGESVPAVSPRVGESMDAAHDKGGEPAAGKPEPEAADVSRPPARAEKKQIPSAAVPQLRVAGDAEQGKYGQLTEQILEYFASTDASVRARDVAAALGRDTDSGSINAVRSTLDRLVGASRIHRAGRGLYRANPS